MKRRALILDDSRFMRRLLMQCLQSTGLAQFEFSEAADVAEALEQFTQAPPDLAFVDWHLPFGSGVDFVRWVRAGWEGSTIPLILVTAEKRPALVAAALNEAGATAYVTKPFTPEQLTQTLAPILAGMAAAPDEP